MSGPKTSSYRLTARQRQAILEQLRRQQELVIKEEMRKKASKNLQDQCAVLKAELNGLENVLGQVKKTVSDGDLKEVDYSKYNNIITEATQSISKALSKVNKELGEINSEEQTISKMISEVSKKTIDANNLLKQQEEIFRDVTINRLSEGFKISFAGITNRRELKNNEYLPKILEALEETVPLYLSEILNHKLEDIKKKAADINDVDFLSNFYSISVIPFVKECKLYDSLWTRYGEEYDKLTIRYKHLCDELQEEMEPIEFSEDAVTNLLDRISVLEQKQLKTVEDEYICKCIDEAMVELGYRMVGTRDVTKKSGKHFRNELFSFSEGTVVNVTYTDDGHVTMELGAVDTQNRIPTGTETKGLVEEMTNFCSEYSELEKKLQLKGIEPKRIAILPPNAEYAQVIDISGYEMTEEVSNYHHKQRSNESDKSLHRGE